MKLEDIIKQTSTTLLDVREEDEVQNEGSVKGAILIPMNQIPSRIEEIKNFSSPIVVFCRSGVRSGKIIEYLTKLGFKDLYNGGGFKEINSILEK